MAYKPDKGELGVEVWEKLTQDQRDELSLLAIQLAGIFLQGDDEEPGLAETKAEDILALANITLEDMYEG